MSLRTSRACRVGFEQSDCNTNQDLIGAIEMLDRCIDLLRQCHDAGVEVNVETMAMLRTTTGSTANHGWLCCSPSRYRDWLANENMPCRWM